MKNLENDILSVITSYLSTAQLPIDLITTGFYFVKTKKFQNTYFGAPCMRIGRCVISPYLTNTSITAIQDAQDISRNILLAILICRRFLKTNTLSRFALPQKVRLSALYRLIKKKYSKMSVRE